MPTYRACVCTEGDISQHRAPVAAPVGARRGLHDHARLAVDLLLRLLQGRRRGRGAAVALCPLRRDFGCLHPSAPGDWQPEGLGLWKPKGLGFCHLLEQRAVFARARFAGVGGGPEK